MPQHIVIIDDDRELLSELKDLLESAGYLITTFSDPVSGLGFVKNMPPDLLLLDIKMPEITGIQLAAMMRMSDHSVRTPIIFLSGIFNQAEITATMQACKIDKYLEKPVSPELLLKTIEEVFMAVRSGATQ